MTLWSQVNTLLVEYSNTRLAPINEELWEDLKKHGDKLGKHCRVENMVIARAFPEKARELQRSIDCLSTLVHFNTQF